MNVKVTGCKDCPMLNEDNGETCKHPESKGAYITIFDKFFNIITPDWCPLNKEPITIEKV